MSIHFQGNLVALVTPFRDGRLDRPALAALVDHAIEGGVSALVPCGTTGESPTLNHDEHDEVVAFVVETARGRVPVVAGTGSNSTVEAVRLTRAAERNGAAAVLSVTPYYNRPSRLGLERHYGEVADCSSLPVILYDIPGRTGTRMDLDTIAAIAEHDRVVAIKVATGDVEDVTRIRGATSLAVLSGDDALTLPMMALGASGVISVLSNLLPRDMTELVRAAAAGELQTARERHDRLYPLMRAMFLETNPVPIKTALAMADRIAEEMRLPLCPMTSTNRERLRSALLPFIESLERS